MRNLIPWKWGREIATQRDLEEHPIVSFQRAVNSLFEDFFKGYDLSTLTTFEQFTPRIDMHEDEKQLKVVAELPGIDEKDIEINVNRNTLTIKGEKKTEKEEAGKESFYRERSYGSFQRMITIPTDVDTNKIDATIKKGVLTVILPKVPSVTGTQKKITVKSM